jgi:hypothetical protein
MFETFHFGDLTNEYKIMYMIYVLSHNKFSLDTKTMYSKFDTKTINKMTKQIYELIIESSKPMKYKTSLLKALHKKYVLHTIYKPPTKQHLKLSLSAFSIENFFGRLYFITIFKM